MLAKNYKYIRKFKLHVEIWTVAVWKLTINCDRQIKQLVSTWQKIENLVVMYAYRYFKVF